MLQHEFLPTLPSLLTQPNVPLIHRDLSWLQFNERVLAEARQGGNPLLERTKFLAISASNLDEFFMIRLASLGRSITASLKRDEKMAKRLTRIRSSILEAVAKFGAKQAEALDLLRGELEAEGILIVRKAQPGEAAFEQGKKVFDEQVLPKLSPPEAFSVTKLALLENFQTAAVFPNGFWFRVPKALPTVIPYTPEGSEMPTFFFLDDLLRSHLGTAFNFEERAIFVRLTRDGDFTVDLEEEDPESIPDVVRTGLGSREKGKPVRLQYLGEYLPELFHDAANVLKLVPGQILPAPHTLNLSALWSVVGFFSAGTQLPALRYPPLVPVIPPRLAGERSIFDELRDKDQLLHHPYDSFDGYVRFVQAACADPLVTSIEQTVYRMDTLSPVIDALKTAAQSKRVRVLIELRARFDELNNLALADQLRKAGVEVSFGFGKLKLHAKVALVTRTEEGGERRYTHLSTGNYNATTARQYTDLAILTAHPEIGADARVFFDTVAKGEVPSTLKQIVSAPTRLHRRLLNHIQVETEAARKGKRARIVAKVNALVDGAVIDHLYRASKAGVQVDLIVRGACSLIPGIKGLSENIRVISVVDRFLEHSRIYYFESAKALYLSSADWMPRNFFSRLEIAFPILDPHVYDYLTQIVIPIYLSDTMKSRELTPQGTWKKRAAIEARFPAGSALEKLAGKKPIRSQLFFEQLAQKAYEGTPIA